MILDNGETLFQIIVMRMRIMKMIIPPLFTLLILNKLLIHAAFKQFINIRKNVNSIFLGVLPPFL